MHYFYTFTTKHFNCVFFLLNQELGVEHLRALAALPRLTVLNLQNVFWAEDAEVAPALARLVAHLPRLRVMNAPDDVLVRRL